MSQSIPVDPQVRIGHLENGLTYYIRHNEEPKGQANFYIAQKVGSILEEEEQRGLAHFLEHMCFNGTKNFPGNNVIKYCESIGVKFGADLNAYTSIDETVYNIDNVPVGNVPSAIDSCLLILHDWADGLLLEGDDIDHERGVIREEWRSRMNAQMRMYETLLPKAYPGNRYGERMPIGLLEVIENFPYKAIRDYYEKWYRPDQQGIVVVGDIDVDAVEGKIKDIFSTIETPVNPAERFYTPIENNQEPIIAIAKDKEQPYAISYVFMKHEPIPSEMKSDMTYLIMKYALGMADAMMQQRLAELAQSPEPPFVQGVVQDDDYFLSKTEGAYTGIALTGAEGIEEGVTAVYREMLRAIRNGFTESEYDRARADYLTYVESEYNQRDKKKSADFCSEYVRHFIDNEPIMGIENEFALAQQLAPNIPVQIVNQLMAQLVSPDSNLVVLVMAPDKEDVVYPTEESMKAAMAAVAAEDIAPYEDNVSDQALMEELPEGGHVKKVKDAKLGYKKYVLSNGVTFYLKSTDFNADQIIMNARSWGGTSYYKDSESINLRSVNEVMGIGGLGQFSATDLNKVLAGKKVSVNRTVSIYNEAISGSTTPKDFETMMQLVYLGFTDVRTDEEAFKSWQTRTRAALLNAEAQPTSSIQDTIYSTLYQNSAQIRPLKSYEIDQVDYARCMQIAKERFADASDFIFFFTGNIDEETIIPLIEKYLGGLPTSGKKEKLHKTDAAKLANGVNENVFERQMEVPSSIVVLLEKNKTKYSLKSEVLSDIAMQALGIVLMEEIREKEGGTYSIQADGAVQCVPEQYGMMQVVFQTDPEKVDYLTGRVNEIIADFAANGPSEENMSKAKEYMLKSYQENLRENRYHQNVMNEYVVYGIDFMTDYEKVVNEVTADQVRKVVVDLLKAGNHGKVIMNGVK